MEVVQLYQREEINFERYASINSETGPGEPRRRH